jgi:tetratricopeptide (TPR) repeat protein
MNSARAADRMPDQRPFVFISYSQDSPAHNARVAKFARRLIALGIECRLDQFEKAPPEGWPRWMKRQIEQARLILVVCTANYRRRFDGEQGRGANWEGYLITQQLYEAGAVNTRAIPVMTEANGAAHIPLELRASQYYQLDSPSEADLIARVVQAMAAAPALPAAGPVPAAGGLWTVPYARNPVFTGRENSLADLRSGFETRPVQAVTGLGGTGKTELAVEYACRHRNAYRTVLWAAADDSATLLSSFDALASKLDLPEAAGDDQHIAAAAAVRWLERNGGWLLVLDFASEPGALAAYLPATPNGHVLITSRNASPEVTGVEAGIELGALSPAEALEFLRRRVDREPLDALETEAAGALAAQLECLPLALEQAAAYARRMRASFAHVFAGYRARGSRLLSAARPERYARALADAWMPGFAQIQGTAPASADLARLLSLLAPAPVPLDMIARAAPELGPAIAGALAGVAADPLLLDELLAPLLDFSLLTRPAEDACQLHRLVQEAIAGSFDAASRAVWTERAVRALDRVFPAPEFPVWPACERLVAHALACCTRAETEAVVSPETAALLNRTAQYLMARGRLGGLENFFLHSMRIWEEAYGPSHPLTAMAASNLGNYRRMTGNYAEAEAPLERAREILAQAGGREAAMAANNLALLLMETGRTAEAEPLFRGALEQLRQAGAGQGEDTALLNNNLGEICRAQGRYPEARPFYERAIARWLEAQGVLSPSLAATINNLGLLENAEGRYPEAEQAYLRALEVTEQSVGPEHPQCSAILNNLGDLYRVSGRYREAEDCLRRAYSVAAGALGPRHSYAARALGNLGLLFSVEERYGEAEPLIAAGMEITAAALGPEHPMLAPMLNNLGELYRNQGQPERARPLFERAIAIVEKSSGPLHPELLSLLNNLALTSIAADDFGAAGRELGRALAIAAAALPASHPQVKPMVANLAAVRILGGRPSCGAEEFFAGALGADHPGIDAWAAEHAGLLAEVGANGAEIRAEYERDKAARSAAASSGAGPEAP